MATSSQRRTTKQRRSSSQLHGLISELRSCLTAINWFQLKELWKGGGEETINKTNLQNYLTVGSCFPLLQGLSWHHEIFLEMPISFPNTQNNCLLPFCYKKNHFHVIVRDVLVSLVKQYLNSRLRSGMGNSNILGSGLFIVFSSLQISSVNKLFQSSLYRF